MRRTTLLTAACLGLAALAGAAVAQSGEQNRTRRTAPASGEPTPTSAISEYSVLARRAGQPEKGTFLGLSTSAAQPALQKQLQLKPGVGLVVDAVDAGSPAEQAGVKEFDILHKLDDQILINEEQLGVLVRTYEPGKEVTLTVIREGKPQQLKAKLAERELPLLRLMFDDLAPAQVNYGVLNLRRAAGNDAVEFLTRAKLLEARGDVVEMRSPDGGSTLKAAQITIEDDRHKMTVSSRAGRKHLRVEDKSGKVVFEGPIETKEELDKIPADLRQAYTDILLDAAPAQAPPLPPAPTPAPTERPVLVAPAPPEPQPKRD